MLLIIRIDPWPDQDEMKTLTASTVSVLVSFRLFTLTLKQVGEWSAKNWERRGVLHQLLYYRVVSSRGLIGLMGLEALTSYRYSTKLT